MTSENWKRAIAYGADKLVIVDLHKLPEYLIGGNKLMYQYLLASITEILSTYAFGPELGAVSTEALGLLAGGLSTGFGALGSGVPGQVGTAFGTLADWIDPPGLYRFPLNPESVDWSFGKLQNIQKYGYDTYELQYFGNDLVTMRCSGNTLMLQPPAEMLEFLAKLSPQLYDLLITTLPLHLLSPAWIKLHEFDSFYKQSSQELLIIWNWNVYYGYLQDFSWSWTVERAYRIRYDFTFMLHPTKQWKLFSISDEAFNSREREVNSDLAQASVANLYI